MNKGLAGFALAIILGISGSWAGLTPEADLEIHHIDVGQGDCTLILSPTGESLLFDGGQNGKGPVIIDYLTSIGVTSLTYMVASHYHADHIGGLDEVINGGISVDVAAYDRGGSYSSQTYQDYVAAIGEKRTTIHDGQVIDLGGGVKVECVAVNGNGVPGASDENDLCVALKVTYGDFDYFVAGDLSGSNDGGYTDIETSVAPEVGDVEIYRVDHHGSSYSSNQYFVDVLDPEVSIISVGKNSYGHPSKTVVRRLKATSVVYQTEDSRGRIVDGDIVVITDGKGYFSVNGDYYPIVAGGSMHVASIDMSLESKGKRVWAVADVKIVDANNSPVADATVSGHWSGLTDDTDAVTTGSDGVAVITSDKTSPTGWFVFTVDEVSKPDWTYDASANAESSDSIYCTGTLVAGSFDQPVLYQNLPNPFGNRTTILYWLPSNCHVRLAVYDVTGRLVRILVEEPLARGYHSTTWNGLDFADNPVPSGIYFYTLDALNSVQTRKMFLFR